MRLTDDRLIAMKIKRDKKSILLPVPPTSPRIGPRPTHITLDRE
jgi:hypothetical protein